MHASSNREHGPASHQADGRRRRPHREYADAEQQLPSRHIVGEIGRRSVRLRRDTRQYVSASTGVGKSWLACALGHKACRDDRSVFYQRVPRLFDALALARGDGRHGRLLKTLARVELLILDDWGLATLTHDQARDLLEIVDDRHNRGSTIVTSQLPVDHWHEAIANPTVADAILDRLVHNAHRLTLNGDSMRKAAAKRSGLDLSPAK
jgi:hypothetical protein